MTGLLDRQVDAIATKLRAYNGQGFDRAVQRTLRQLNREVSKLQRDFFTFMAQSMIEANRPNLGAYNPTWRPLSPDYEDDREDRFGVDPGSFYRYSGNLETTLSGLKAETIFGKPLVLFQLGDQAGTTRTYNPQGGSIARYRSGRSAPRTAKIDEMQARIIVDLYPRIKGPITKSSALKTTWSVKTMAARGKKRKSIPVNFKLDNFQGQGDRPYLAEFMKWWLHTKARRVVRQAAGFRR